MSRAQTWVKLDIIFRKKFHYFNKLIKIKTRFTVYSKLKA